MVSSLLRSQFVANLHDQQTRSSVDDDSTAWLHTYIYMCVCVLISLRYVHIRQNHTRTRRCGYTLRPPRLTRLRAATLPSSSALVPAPRWRSAAAVLGALRAPDGCRGAGADRPGRPGHPGRCGGPGPGYGLGTSPAGHGRSWQVKASLVLGRKLLHCPNS